MRRGFLFVVVFMLSGCHRSPNERMNPYTKSIEKHVFPNSDPDGAILNLGEKGGKLYYSVEKKKEISKEEFLALFDIVKDDFNDIGNVKIKNKMLLVLSMMTKYHKKDIDDKNIFICLEKSVSFKDENPNIGNLISNMSNKIRNNIR